MFCLLLSVFIIIQVEVLFFFLGRDINVNQRDINVKQMFLEP